MFALNRCQYSLPSPTCLVKPALSSVPHLPQCLAASWGRVDQRKEGAPHAQRHLKRVITASTAASTLSDTSSKVALPKLKVVIAGGGIGGLVLAIGLLKQGFEVVILERDMTAIRGEGKYRGPIQIQSNALAALEALDMKMAEDVMEEGCITGDRVNGLCDGVTGEWYCKFDTFHPAVDKGLPVTRVISRQRLQEILADRCRELGGQNVILNDVHIVDYSQTATSARAVSEDGRIFEGDLLVGADGIWSKIRRKMIGHTEACYSQYTCYTGISNFTPPDIDTVGYRVFLGNEQYFVSSDVGGGKMQWYGFHREPAGGTDAPGERKKRLMEIFGHWCDMVTDLIEATPEEDVLRRDIYDRPPIFQWTDGRVALLGDSAHAMQPNLGQGGCMAIEDAFQLATDLTAEVNAADRLDRSINVEGVLQTYFQKRVLRAAAIHGMAGMAAFMASTYKAYLGEGLGPLESLTRFKIPHPGRVSGQVVLKLTMPAVLQWVLGGYEGSLKKSGRREACRLVDQPQGFKESDFPLFMRDDDALIRASLAEWLLQPSSAPPASLYGICIKGLEGITVGRGDDCDLVIDNPTCSAVHAKLKRDENGDYFVIDQGSQYGTFCNGRQLAPGMKVKLRPSDELRFGMETSGPENVYTVKLRHQSLTDAGGHGMYRRKSDKVDDNVSELLPAGASA
jgi:zeaxanthin epoxidase